MLQPNQSQKNLSQSDELAGGQIDAATPIERTDEHFVERHATFLKRIKEGPIGLLFFGDSIMRRWVETPELWNQYFAKYQPANFGVGGDAVQNLLWRVQNGEIDDVDPHVIVLLIGTNNVPTNTGEEIAIGIRKVVDTIQMKLSETKIILLAIFPRGPQRQDQADVDNPYYMDSIKIVNGELAKLDNGDSIRFLDFGSMFIGADGNIETTFMPDQLHLVEPGYEIWVEAMADLLADMMN